MEVGLLRSIFFKNADDEKYNFQVFQQWMRLCFKVAVAELIDFVDTLRPLGREKQKNLTRLWLAGVQEFVAR